MIDGPVAVVFVSKDPAAVAKVIKDFSKGRKEFYFRADARGTGCSTASRSRPSRSCRRGKCCSRSWSAVDQAPLSRLIGERRRGRARKMVGLLKALSDKKTARRKPAPAPSLQSGRAEPEPKQPRRTRCPTC